MKTLDDLFASLNLTVSISEPFWVCENDWPCIRYSVTINGEAFTYSLGVGHVDFVKARKAHFSAMVTPFTTEDVYFLNTLANGRTPKDKTYTAILAAKVAKLQNVVPNPAEVLACVCREGLDADQSFETWASDYGADSDSIKALEIYNACTANGKKARRILSPANYARFAELSTEL